MHQHDGERAIARVERRPEPGPRRRRVERAQHLAVGRHPLVDLDDVAVERLGQDDLAREDVGPRLVADAQRVAEAGGDRQRDRLALALEQGVGGDRRPHLDRADRAAARLGEDRADAGDRRIVIALGIVGEQFADDQPRRRARGRRCR